MREDRGTDALHEAFLNLVRALPTCVECEHWSGANELCHKPNPPQRPPARIIAYGCSAFERVIPF